MGYGILRPNQRAIRIFLNDWLEMELRPNEVEKVHILCATISRKIVPDQRKELSIYQYSLLVAMPQSTSSTVTTCENSTISTQEDGVKLAHHNL